MAAKRSRVPTRHVIYDVITGRPLMVKGMLNIHERANSWRLMNGRMNECLIVLSCAHASRAV